MKRVARTFARMRSIGLASALSMAVPVLAGAQVSKPAAAPDFLDPGPRAQLLLLGSFHFSYPELDVVKSKQRINVLAPERQREIEELVECLAAYRPTRIAVEHLRERQAQLDSLYALYQKGSWALPPGETYQIGFRLARRLGHDRVYAVDTERTPVLLDLVERQLAPREAELMATDTVWRSRFARVRAYEDSVNASKHRTLREFFIGMNEPAEIARSHMTYHVGFFKFDGEEGGYAGADFVAGWYDRNLRIFRNLQRITTSPDERILLIIGSGHLPILRFVTQHSPEYVLVEPATYLQGSGR